MQENTLIFTDVEFSDRFVTGVVEGSPSQGFIECKLIEPVKGITHARVTSQVLDADDSDVIWSNYSSGSTINIFLNSPMAEKGHWFAYSGAMAEKITNPWLDNTLRGGDFVEGIVISYGKHNYDGEQTVIILLTKNLTQDVVWQNRQGKIYDGIVARLSISKTPLGNNQNLTECVHIGDRIHASILSINDAELSIDLSVNDYLDLRHIHIDTQSTPSDIVKTINKLSPKKTEEYYSILLIDDDEALAKAYQASAKLYGDTLHYASNLKEVQRGLKDTHIEFNAILMDYNLGDAHLEHDIKKEINAFLKQHNDVLIALVSSDGKEAIKDKPDNWAFFSKALNHEQIRKWLETKVAPPIPKYNETQGVAWDKNQGLAKKAFKRAEVLLKLCCDKTNAQSAAWIVMPRAKYYEFRVSYNLNHQFFDGIVPHLQYSLVGSCIEQQKPFQQKKGASRIAVIFPINCEYVWAMPVEVNGIYNRVLLFFSAVPLSEKDKVFLEGKKDHIADLGELLHMSSMLEESQTFAAEGLKLICQQHEISGELQSMLAQHDNLQKILEMPLTIDFQEKEKKIVAHVKELIKSIKRLDDRTTSNLDVINPENEKPYILPHVLKQMQRRINLRKDSEGQVKLEYSPTFPDDIQLNFPRRILEIALINVLDNAWYHSRGNPIIVRIFMSIDDAVMPIRIQIQDYGQGMTVEAQQKLENPRYSRREKGHGMGIYLTMTLLEAHQAKLALGHTVLWAGSCFEIQLPWS